MKAKQVYIVRMYKGIKLYATHETFRGACFTSNKAKARTWHPSEAKFVLWNCNTDRKRNFVFTEQA